MKTPLLLAALALLAGAALVPVFRPARAVTKTPMPPERRLRHQQAGAEMEAGLDALARGDDARARESFRAAVAIDPTAKPILDYRRALVYDRLGRDREAYGAYRDTLFGSPRTSSRASN